MLDFVKKCLKKVMSRKMGRESKSKGVCVREKVEL